MNIYEVNITFKLTVHTAACGGTNSGRNLRFSKKMAVLAYDGQVNLFLA
jgi:hypothetical protein